MVTGFFRIYFPYGIEKQSNGTWLPFNREYSHIGWAHPISLISMKENPNKTLPISLKFNGITDNSIRSVFTENLLTVSSTGAILKVHFYTDRTNPSEHPEYWETYIKHISFFSKFEILNF